MTNNRVIGYQRYYDTSPWWIWNGAPVASATHLGTQTVDVWPVWVTTTNNTTLTNAEQAWQSLTFREEAWQAWAGLVSLQQQALPQQYLMQTPTELTEEQKRAQEEQRRRHEERKTRRTAARHRARSLLESMLSEEQRAELDSNGHFTVVGSRGRCYRIRAQGQSGNVDLLDVTGNVQAVLCAHPRNAHDEPSELLPEGDAWLAQMLEIQTDEDHFLQTANVHRGAIPSTAPSRRRYIR